MVLGSDLDPSINIGPSLAYNILKENVEIVHRPTDQPIMYYYLNNFLSAIMWH